MPIAKKLYESAEDRVQAAWSYLIGIGAALALINKPLMMGEGTFKRWAAPIAKAQGHDDSPGLFGLL